MWNTLHTTWVNRNGDKPTISADSFNAAILCHSILNVSLQMHHTNHMTICSDNHSAFKRSHIRSVCRGLTAPRSPAWPQAGSWRTGWGWCRMWGKLIWCPAPGRSERRSGCLCVKLSSWVRGRSDATVLKVQQTACITTSEWSAEYVAHLWLKLYTIFTIDIKPAGAGHNSCLIFCWHCVPATIVFCCWLNEETHISCGILCHAAVKREWGTKLNPCRRQVRWRWITLLTWFCP